MERLVQSVVQDVPEAPMMTVRDLLAWAVIELCEQGNAWVIDDEPVVVAANTPYAELEAPPGAEPIRVLDVFDGGVRLTPGGDYRQTSPTRIQILRKTNASSLSGRLAVKPMQGNKLPQELLSLHRETLRFGTLSRVLMLPQPWRDTDMAMHYQKYWIAGVNDAKRLSVYGHQYGGVRVQPRRFI
ncbi:hypothetical protein [Vreelandella glaciei]|uniref:hypothetical protein n=1 Tax=Vreelandella glaciei TaxID=186761 RepID=UPI0030ED9B63|tara:strand:- start:2826 stop:3380 length:555 start_codon:yes stop_codon:yes gene_type:complete